MEEIEKKENTMPDVDPKPSNISIYARKTSIINIEKNEIRKKSSNENLNNPPNDILDISFLLCVFDNIVGPKIIHHWSTATPLEDHILKYISIHTLNGELYQDKLVKQLKYRFYHIKEVELAIFSIFFDASTMTSNSYGLQSDSSSQHIALNCFSLIVPLKNKPILFGHYGDNTHFYLKYFENFILEYRVYAEIKPKVNKVTTALDDLKNSIKEFCSCLNVLTTNGIHTANSIDALETPLKIQVVDTYLNDCYFTTPTYSVISNDFLVSAITSHITTNFNTIVIGKSSAAMNKMIKTLAMFMPKEKIQNSCFAVEEYSMLSPYFCLQGLVTENPDELNLLLDANFIFKNDSPLTIVDMSFKQIYRTSILNEFNCNKEKFIQKKLQFLYNSLTLNELDKVYPVSNYLNWISSTSVAQNSTIITVMLKQMDVLETDSGVKDTFIRSAIKSIYTLSLNLIEYVNNEIIEATKIKRDLSVKLSMKKICKDLDIATEQDMHVIISYADYLKPEFSESFSLQP